MISPATADALARISARAQDVLRAYTAGGSATFDDVNVAAAVPQKSADPLSVAAPPDAYFALGGRDGGRAFTRDGGFRLAGGALVNAQGDAVLGFPGGEARGRVAEPLALPVRDVALGRCSDVRVESDGTLSYTRRSVDPRSGVVGFERVTAGRLALARFPAGTQPVRLDDTRVAAPPGLPPHLGAPADGTFAGLATYARDTGRVDILTGLDKLAEAYRAFAAVSAAHRAHGSTDKVAMDLLK